MFISMLPSPFVIITLLSLTLSWDLGETSCGIIASGGGEGLRDCAARAGSDEEAQGSFLKVCIISLCVYVYAYIYIYVYIYIYIYISLSLSIYIYIYI